MVAGTFEVEPDQREEYLAARHDIMRKSRGEPGCIEFMFSADPIDPSRVILFELWESQSALDTHRSAMRTDQTPIPQTNVKAKTASIMIYDVTGPRPLGD
jgi:quinol monooxygenase YgiN